MLAGHAAVSFLADLTDNMEQQVVYTVYALIDSTGIKFRFMIPSDAFEELKPKLDSIVDSFKMN